MSSRNQKGKAKAGSSKITRKRNRPRGSAYHPPAILYGHERIYDTK